MHASVVLILLLACPLPTEARSGGLRSGKNNNITVIFISGQKLPDRVDPVVSLKLDEKGRLLPGGGLLGEVEDLKVFLRPLFGKNNTGELLIHVINGDKTSLMTVQSLIDKLSNALDKDKVLTLYIRIEAK
jgi:hypothetical protein